MSEVIFSEDQIAVIQAAAEAMIPADEYDGGAGELSPGYVVATRVRYQPPVAALYLKGLKGIDDSVEIMFGDGRKFADLDIEERTRVLNAIRSGAAPGRTWQDFSSQKFWGQLRQDVFFIYMTDPEVCQRIGFGGESTEKGGYPDQAEPQS